MPTARKACEHFTNKMTADCVNRFGLAIMAKVTTTLLLIVTGILQKDWFNKNLVMLKIGRSKFIVSVKMKIKKV